MSLEIHIDASPRVALASHPRYRQKVSTTKEHLDSTTEAVTNLREYLVTVTVVRLARRTNSRGPAFPFRAERGPRRLRLRDKKKMYEYRCDSRYDGNYELDSLMSN